MKNSGFTLIELMTVILILGLVATFAIPNLMGSMPLRRLNNSATGLKGQLMIAMAKAISEGVPYIIAFTNNGTSFQVVKDLNANGLITSGEPSTSVSYEKEITNDSIPSGSPSVVIFSPRGEASTSGSIRLTTTSNNKIRIHIVPSGSVIVQK